MVNTILFVDDEEIILKALTIIFSREGFQALAASNGKEALSILSREDVDIVVSDERMPGLSGTELLTMVKEQYPEKIRVLLTAYAELNTMLSAINKAEAHRMIVKPYNNDDFVQTIKTLMAKKQENQKRENSLKRSEREADFAFRAAKIMCSKQLSVQEKYSRLLNTLKEYIRARTLSLMLVHPDGKEIVVQAATNEKIIGLRNQLSDHSISAWVAREGQAYLFNGKEDQDKPSDFVPHDKTMTRYQSGAFLSVPVKNDENTIGVFNITDHQEGRISCATEKTVTHLIRWVGAMIQNPTPNGFV
ncbi:MAG: response regulator [bacterium]